MDHLQIIVILATPIELLKIMQQGNIVTVLMDILLLLVHGNVLLAIKYVEAAL